DLKLRNGTIYTFGEYAPVQSIRDRYGNQITLTRSGGGNGPITQVSSTSGRWVRFAYDSYNRVTQATDNVGRTVSYAYDASGRLSTVTDARGGTTTYTYDTANRMTSIEDPRGIVYLRTAYDSNGRVATQTQADG